MSVKNSIYVISIVFLIFFLQSCSDEKSKVKNIKSSSSKLNFVSPKSGNTFVFGDSILFVVKAIDVKKPAEKISLFINGELIIESLGDSLHYWYPTKDGSGGKIRVKGVVQFRDGTNSRRRIGLTIVSDEIPKKLTYQLINTFPHDPTSYTQGLIYDSEEDLLYEGTGNYTESRLLKTKVGNEQADVFIEMPDEYFGEGITIFHDTIFQLTYKNKKGFYYNRDFELLGEFTYPTEGWGLTHDDTSLIMSDGSANLYYINPRSFRTEKNIQVFSDKGQLFNINELEYVDGVIYANIYTTDYIAKIDAKSGKLLALINMEGILEKEDVIGKIDVLNGIAFNPSMQSFYVTGKWWPKLFEVRFTEKE
jgi:glutamine cyclotransferase